MRSLLALLMSLGAVSPVHAQIISSAADNDMDPRFVDDGWENTVGSYDVIAVGGSLGAHMYLEPPDGNAYGGGVQFGGDPGTRETIEKEIAGLTAGVAYAVEWYIMTDAVGSNTEDAWFEVEFCSESAETLRLPFSRRREWIREVQVFTADAATCRLRFRARTPTGGGSNWIFLDSVQVAVATSTDFGIAVTGPAFAVSGSTHPVDVTISHLGPDGGTPPVVTYPLPEGASVLGGSAGSLSVGGADGGSWGCEANAESPQAIECTRTTPMTSGDVSVFRLDVDFALAPGATVPSTLRVEPTFQAGNADPNEANDFATFETRAPRCGDGAVEGGEMCDDGNGDEGDGCAACGVETGWTCPVGSSCVPTCGDGLLRGTEMCDDGNGTPGDGCTDCATDAGWTCGTLEPSMCVAERCGDAIVAGLEECDDGDTDPGDGCDAACVIEDAFTCGGSPSVCEPGVCGDGFVASVEGCDDGNTVEGDGCSATCVVEAGWDCPGAPSVCAAAACGDGIPVGAERCDDGNDVSGDGCDACAEEPGWTCVGAPSVCDADCGDGALVGDEGCDDGNAAAGDGCSATCTVEDGFACAGEPSVCAALCGDGALSEGEACDDGNTVDGDGCSATCESEDPVDAGPADAGPPGPSGTVVGGFCSVHPSGSPNAVWVLALLGLVMLRRRWTATRR
ncbi:MAG: DUF4215 domain-containing protein [Sandaracinaceae bacterium]